MKKLRDKENRWKEKILELTIEKGAERKKSFKTASGIKIKELYLLLDLVTNNNRIKDDEFPGEYPYIRGIFFQMNPQWA